MPAARGGRVIAAPPRRRHCHRHCRPRRLRRAHARLVLTTRPRGTGHCLRPMRRAAASVAPSRLGWGRQCTCGRPSRARLSLASPGPRDRASRMAWRLPDAVRAHHRGHMISDRRAPSRRTRPLLRGFVGTPSRVSFDARHDAPPPPPPPPPLPCRPPPRPGGSPRQSRRSTRNGRPPRMRPFAAASPRMRVTCAAPHRRAEPPRPRRPPARRLAFAARRFYLESVRAVRRTSNHSSSTPSSNPFASSFRMPCRLRI
ncbi:Uncharacterised protein [Burkholderia pseudomallei]|nr:Uncharacterised protein [Burkholderia pseudomallei]CAJ2846632.1 Uncharacterised protein [Burkholderia pseudomallei]CAJ5338821.1 Uncharacterised protein [Burkholderia pseudomallei]CAJ5932118.1 Uncharacterised protein [Burkholderia pseudomallei]CAJ6661697.1 Uncharacterised protein [Burkholderia pseudomallei]